MIRTKSFIRCASRFILSTSIVGTSTLSLSAAGGCATSPSSPRAVTQATPAQQAALLDRVKVLEGEWTKTDESGATITASTFKVASNGSAVREIMFPGHAHEMTNLYTMDGDSLILTHYCAIGNQPRMRAHAPSSATGPIVFKFDSVTNWAGGDQSYMGEMTLEFVDSDHIIERWSNIQNGVHNHGAEFVLTRKK